MPDLKPPPAPPDPNAPAPSGDATSAAGPELRFVDRKAFVGLGAFPIAEGIRIADLTLQIPNVTFPFNVTGGAARYQKQRCLFGQLDLEIAPPLLKRAEAGLLAHAPELAHLRLTLRAGFIEAEGALREGAAFTARIAFDAEGDGVAALAFDVRLYAPSRLPAPLVAGLLARAAVLGQLAPGAQPRGFGAAAAFPLAELLRRTVPQKGFRLPETSAARLGSALVSPAGLMLRFSSGGPPPGGLADEDLLVAVEGAHAFEEGERLLEAGALSRAREFYLRAAELAQAHPFAVERLIGLLVGDADVTDYALDLVRALAQRRPRSPAPLWMEALLRLQRGEHAIAAQRYLDLAALARGRGEESSAFWAAQAASTIAAEKAPQLAVRALHESLGLRPDHFPSLTALAEAAHRAGDDAAALRAYRRLTAVSRDSAQAARAHVRLGELCARVENDLAGARLHYDAALRLVPDDPEALLGLADLCARSGEPLRALRSLDRVRELCKDDPKVVGRAELEAGAVYEHALHQLENARLRYQASAAVLPGDPEPRLRVGLIDERLGRAPEALAELAEALELLGPEPKERRHLAHLAHRSMARLHRDVLHRPDDNRVHLEAAVALKADDLEAWEELIPLYRADERFGPLALALARAAPRAEPKPRVRMLVEAAELHRLRLGEPQVARERYTAALAVDPRSREALEGTLALDELFGEMGAACEHLRALLDLSPPGPARLPLLRRLVAAARDGKKDLDLAARATRDLLQLAPDDLSARGELVTLQRRRGDLPALAEALEGWAQACERTGDAAATAQALRELGQLYEARLGRRDDALSALEKAHALAPADLGVLADLADLALRAARHRLARQAYRALVAALPADAPNARRAELYDRLSRSAEAIGDLNEAVTALEEAYRLGGDDALAERLDGLLGSARRDEARADLARRRGAALARAGRSGAAAQVMLQGALLSRAQGDAPGASRDFAAALATDPQGPTALPALEALADLALALGQPAEAATYLSRRAALTLDSRSAARLLFRSAELCTGLDDARALHFLGLCIQRDGSFAPARRALSERRARAGDPAAAYREAEAALEVAAPDPDALTADEAAALEQSAARLAERAGEQAAATRLWSRYLTRRPDDVAARVAQVELLRTGGDRPALALALEALEARETGEKATAVARELAHLYAGPLAQPAAAIAANRRVLAQAPENREALLALADLLVAPNEIDARVEVLERLAALASAPAEAAVVHFRRGEVLRQAFRPAAAAEAFRAAAATASDPAPALDALVACAEEAHQTATELSARRQRADLAARRGEADAATRLLDVADRLEAAEDPSGARACLNRLMALVPPPELARAAHRRLGRIARTLGDLRAALDHAQQLAALSPLEERVPLLRDAAKLAVDLGEPEAARDALLAALASAPHEQGLVEALLQVQHQLGDAEGEAESLATLAEVPTAPRAERAERWLRAARLHASLNAPPRAEAALRRALALQPDLRPAQAELSERLLKRGELREGLDLLERVADGEADSGQAAEELLRGAHLAQRDLSDGASALRLARKALRRAPSHPGATRLTAERAYLAGAIEEAASLLPSALDGIDADDHPDEYLAMVLMLAELRADQGQPAQALGPLTRASDLAPWRSDVALALHRAQAASDPRAALARLRQHLRALHPGAGSHRLLRLTGRAARRSGDLELAATLLEEALPTAGDGAEALERELIALHLELGQLHAAVGLLRGQGERARTAGDPVVAIASWAQAAELLERSQAWESAAELWGQVIEGEERRGRHREAARALVHRGELYRTRLQRLEDAEVDFRHAMEVDLTELDAVRAAQEVCRARDDAEGEAELLEVENARSDDPRRRPEVLLRLAELALGPLASPARAETALRATLVLDPRQTRARDLWEGLLRGQNRSGDLANSKLARADAVSQPELRVSLLREAARLFVGAAQAGQAADALEQARAIAPDDEGLALESAAALHAAGREDDCALVDSALLSRNPAREPCFGRELARRQQQGDQRGLASLHQNRALAEPPELAVPRFLTAAELFEAAGDADSARRCELWAFERAPQDTAAFARAVLRHQRPEQLRVLDGILRRRAAAVESEAGRLHFERARLLASQDELDLACDALDEALTADAEADDGETYAGALLLRADLEAGLRGPAAAARFDERLVDRKELGAVAHRRVCVRLASTRLAAGQDAEAALLWERALPSAPTAEALPILDRLGSVYTRLGDAAAQARVLVLRAALSPDERVALLRAAAELVQEGPLALEVLRGLAEARPAPADLLRLARLELSEGEPSGPDTLVRAARAALVPSQQATLLLEASLLLDQGGRPSDAIALRTDARRADPHHLEALRAGARDLRTGGDAAERRAVLEALVDLESELTARVGLRRELAELLARDAPARALEHLVAWAAQVEGEARREPLERAEALCRRAHLQLELAGVLEQRADLDPARASALLLEAAALWRSQNEAGRARAALRRAAQLDAQAAAPWAALAELAGELGERADQARALEEYGQRLPLADRAPSLDTAAQLYLQEGHPAAALTALRLAAEAQPTADRYRRLAEASLAQGRGPAALTALTQSLQLEPKGVDPTATLLALAQLSDDLADPTAEAWWARLVDLQPLEATPFDRLADLLRTRGATGELADRLEVRAGALTAAQRAAAELWSEAARLRADRREHPQAIADWRQAAHESPGEAGWWMSLELAALAGQDDAARREAVEHRAPLESVPAARAAAYALLAKLHDEAGDSAAALEALRAAVDARPEDAELTESLLTRLEATAAWVEVGQRLGRVRPIAAATARRRAHALEKAGDRAAAADALLEGLRVAGSDAELAVAFDTLVAGEAPAAQGDLLERRAALAEGPVRAALWVRVAALREGEPRRAALRAAFDADPSSAEAYAQLRQLLADHDHDEDLAELLKRRAEAVAAPAERALLLAELGELREGVLEDLEGAAEAYEQSLRADPSSAHVRRDLAELSFDLARDDRARELFLALATSGPEAARAHVESRLAELAVRRGDAADESRWRGAVATRDPSAENLGALLEAAHRARDAAGQTQALTALVELGTGDHPALLRELADLELAAGQKREAANHLWARIRLVAEDLAGWRELLELAAGLADRERELEAATYLADHEPEPHTQAMMHLARARLLAAENDWVGACASCEAAHRLTPGDELALREGCRYARQGNLRGELARLGRALADAAGDAAVQDFARDLGEALRREGDREGAFRFLSAALPATPDEVALLMALVELAEALGHLRPMAEWVRRLHAQGKLAEAGATLRRLADRIERELGDRALAAELFSQAFLESPPTGEELEQQAQRLESLGQLDGAARAQAELCRRSPENKEGWARLAQVARQASLLPLAQVGDAVAAFLGGALPDQPSKPSLDSLLRERLLRALPAGWRTPLAEESRAMWATLAPPPKTLRPAGPALLGRLQALTEALGVPRPTCVMNPGAKDISYAGPDVLVVGVGVFGLPARAQDYLLALALARSAIALPFAPASAAASWSRLPSQVGEGPELAALQAIAESLAAAVADDALGAMVGQTAADPRFAQADPRAWDRAAALAGPASRGAAAAIAAALARLDQPAP